MDQIQKAVRNVRNFWIELEVDGKPTKVATGPRSKDGGFSLRVLCRENGSISEKTLIVRGFVNPDGTLGMTATMDNVHGDSVDSEDGSCTMLMSSLKR